MQKSLHQVCSNHIQTNVCIANISLSIAPLNFNKYNLLILSKKYPGANVAEIVEIY